MRTLPPKIFEAIQLLQIATLPEPENFISMFSGLPSNYRISIFSEHYYPNKLTFKRMMCSNPLQQATRETAFTIEVNLQKISGIPLEQSARQMDILARGVKYAACYCEQIPEPEVSLEKRPVFLTNICKLYGKLHDKFQDKWVFEDETATADTEKSCLLQCNPTPIMQMFDKNILEAKAFTTHLFLYVELFVTMKIPKEYRVRQRDVIKYSSIDDNAPLLLGDTTGARMAGEERASKETLDRGTSTTFRNHSTNKCRNVDMCCGWAFIPLSPSIIDPSSATRKLQVDVLGGSPFVYVKIKETDIQRRSGTWQMLKRSMGYKAKSKIELTLTSIPAIIAKPRAVTTATTVSTATAGGGGATTTAADPSRTTTAAAAGGTTTLSSSALAASLSINHSVRGETIGKLLFPGTTDSLEVLPDNIILPTSSIAAVVLYRKLMADNGLFRAMETVRKVAISNQIGIIISNFPRIMEDPAACDAFLWIWRKLLPNNFRGRIHFTIQDLLSAKLNKIFNKIVLHLWAICNLHAAKPDSTNLLETEQEIARRKDFIKQQLATRLSVTDASVGSIGLDLSKSVAVDKSIQSLALQDTIGGATALFQAPFTAAEFTYVYYEDD
jgi:hypothetical protein